MNELYGIDERNEVLDNFHKKNELLRNIKNYNMLGYLPVKNENETEDEYKERLKNAYFLNKIDKNINIFCSKPFKSDFKIKSSNPEVSNLAANFTGSKITATDFLKSVLNYSLWFSQAHIFVDYSLKKNHLVSLIELSEMRDYEYDEDGELIYLRFRTEEQVRNGFKVEKYKVIKEYKKENGKVYWNDYVSQNISGLQTTNNLNYEARNVNQKFGLDRIPLVSFYPMATLEKFNPDIIFKNAAEIQLIHYKSASRMKNSEHLLTTPTQLWKEVEIDDEEDRILPYNEKRAIALTSGTVEWLKPPVEIIDNLQGGLKILEGHIDDLMGDILYGKTNGTTTATESVLNASNTNTFLGSIANSLQWTAEEIINIIIEWKNILNKDFETSITTDFTVQPDANKVNNLLNLKLNNIISSKTVFEECKNMSLFNQDIKWEDEQIEVQQEIGTQFNSFESVTDIEDAVIIEEDNKEEDI